MSIARHWRKDILTLDNVYRMPKKDRLDLLYALLAERTPEQSISHKRMPTLKAHEKFVESHPYAVWYAVVANGSPVGAIYLTERNEIGLSILIRHQRQGYGKKAVLELMKYHKGPYYANVNPANEASRKLWECFGAKLLQVTYEIPVYHR